MITALVLSASMLLGQTQHAPQLFGSEPLPPAQEERAQRLGKQLRCAVCQGLSIADSPAQMARAQLDTVRSLVAEGKSDEEIKAYFVDRYGEWALLSPPAHGFNWVVWAGPALVLLIGAVAIRALFRKPAAAPTAPAAPSTPPAAGDEEDPYLKAVRAELER